MTGAVAGADGGGTVFGQGGVPAGMAPVSRGGAGGRPPAGGIAPAVSADAVGRDGAAGDDRPGCPPGDPVSAAEAAALAEAAAPTAACWADVSFCSSSENRCMVRASNASRSLFSRPCSSRSDSYCASLRPAVPTHWSTGLTCAPGGITSMLVTRLGSPLAFGVLCPEEDEPEKAKIIHSRPTPPLSSAASSAN